MIIDGQIHVGTSFLKNKFKQNSELLLVYSLFSNVMSNVKLRVFIKRKINLGDAGIFLEFPLIRMNPLSSGPERTMPRIFTEITLFGEGMAESSSGFRSTELELPPRQALQQGHLYTV